MKFVNLDIDIILALVKEEDWLKEYINIYNFINPKTSSLTIIEARIVLQRKYSRKMAIKLLKEINKLKIKIIPVGKKL
ncbi:MAG: hypothetical protein AABX77_00475, partial [Nanoarchaeota archaeon]